MFWITRALTNFWPKFLAAASITDILKSVPLDCLYTGAVHPAAWVENTEITNQVVSLLLFLVSTTSTSKDHATTVGF